MAGLEPAAADVLGGHAADIASRGFTDHGIKACFYSSPAVEVFKYSPLTFVSSVYTSLQQLALWTGWPSRSSIQMLHCWLMVS